MSDETLTQNKAEERLLFSREDFGEFLSFLQEHKTEFPLTIRLFDTGHANAITSRLAKDRQSQDIHPDVKELSVREALITSSHADALFSDLQNFAEHKGPCSKRFIQSNRVATSAHQVISDEAGCDVSSSPSRRFFLKASAGLALGLASGGFVTQMQADEKPHTKQQLTGDDQSSLWSTIGAVAAGLGATVLFYSAVQAHKAEVTKSQSMFHKGHAFMVEDEPTSESVADKSTQLATALENLMQQQIALVKQEQSRHAQTLRAL